VLNPSLEDSVLIEVIERLDVLSSTRLFLPFGARFQIRTTRDDSRSLSYFVQIAFSARSAVMGELLVSHSGMISAGSTPLTATIFVTDSYKGLNQTVAIFVEVAAIAHISVTPAQLLWSTGGDNVAPYFLPLGLAASFVAKLHDSSGRAFDTCDVGSLQVGIRCDVFAIH
jgi:hypothetical protein